MRSEELDKRIDSALSGWATPSKRGKNAIWQEITGTIEAKQKRFISFSRWQWAAAASLAGIIVCSAVYFSNNVTYTTQSAGLTVNLPDGSLVKLNKASEASYNSIAWFFNRSIALSGEAFFEVKKGSQFSVHTNNGVVQVLGTSFNVLSRKNNFAVECFTGRVKIDNSVNELIITKGERVVQAQNLQLAKETSNHKLAAPLWLKGKYTYSKVALVHVFKDIAKQYGKSIKMNSKIEKMTFSGEWDAIMKLEDVLAIVCLPFNIEAVHVSEKEIRIQKVAKQPISSKP